MELNLINRKLYKKIIKENESVEFKELSQLILTDYIIILNRIYLKKKPLSENTVSVVKEKIKDIYENALKYEFNFLGDINIDGIYVEDSIYDLSGRLELWEIVLFISEEINKLARADYVGSEDTAYTLAAISSYIGLKPDFYIRELAEKFNVKSVKKEVEKYYEEYNHTLSYLSGEMACSVKYVHSYKQGYRDASIQARKRIKKTFETLDEQDTLTDFKRKIKKILLNMREENIKTNNDLLNEKRYFLGKRNFIEDAIQEMKNKENYEIEIIANSNCKSYGEELKYGAIK